MYLVTHKHRLRDCHGTLTFTRAALQFESDEPEDAFAVGWADVSVEGMPCTFATRRGASGSLMASMRSASSRTGKREPFSGGKRDLSLANFVAYPSEGAFLTGQLFGPCTMNGGLFGSEAAFDVVFRLRRRPNKRVAVVINALISSRLTAGFILGCGHASAGETSDLPCRR